MYRVTVLIFVFLLLFPLSVGAENDINHLNVNVREIDEVKMVGLRSLGEELDWGVEFLPKKKAVRLLGQDAILEMEAGNEEFFGRELAQAPVIDEGRIYVSLDDVNILLEEMKVEDPPQVFTSMSLDSHEFDKGDTVSGKMVLYNIDDEDLTLEFASGQDYDLLLYKEGKQVWKLSEGKMYTMAIQTENLSGGESLVFEFEFESEEDLEPGIYELRGVITTRNKIEAGSVGIEVK